MSPPTDSQGPTELMTRTVLGPQSSKASYSGEISPPGLSAPMSGRWGTNLARRHTHEYVVNAPRNIIIGVHMCVLFVLHSTAMYTKRHVFDVISFEEPLPHPHLTVTALPTHFIPLASGLAPSMNDVGQPMTQRPSIRAWVESLPSLPRSSSEMVVGEAAGPVLKRAPAMAGTAEGREKADFAETAIIKHKIHSSGRDG